MMNPAKLMMQSLALLAILATVTLHAPQAVAESLAAALSSAYKGNPTLRAEQARQRGTDEQVPQALSGWRPTVTYQAQAGYQYSKTDGCPTGGFSFLTCNSSGTETYPGQAQITLTQPIFRGFKTVEGTAAAEATVRAGRQNLLAVEQQVLFNAVQAYMNVLRDRRIVKLQEQNVAALREQLNAAQTRFSVGEVTRTDVSQARARLALEQGNLATFRFNLAASIANYTDIIGYAPGSLTYPRMPALPKSLDAAIVIADRLNPNILAAAFIEDAAIHTIKVTRGDLLPQLSLQAFANDSAADLSADPLTNTKTVSVLGVFTMPLYEAGSVYSAVRQAKQVASQRRIQVVEQGRRVRESVSSSWSAVQATYQTIAAGKVQVAAARQALEGVRQEYLVGSRTTLDVLDAERELYNAQINLAREERDLIVAAYQVLGAMGKLTAKSLRLNVDYYDVEENYLAVRDKWFGTDVETVK